MKKKNEITTRINKTTQQEKKAMRRNCTMYQVKKKRKTNTMQAELILTRKTQVQQEHRQRQVVRKNK
jgi:hypothetical protein